MIIEVENAHYLPTTSWRPRKTGGVIQSESWDLRIKEGDGINLSSRAREDEMRCPSSSSEARWRVGWVKGWIPPSSTFCSSQAFNGLVKAHPHWTRQLLYWVHWFLCESHLETLSQTYQKLYLIWTPHVRSRWHLRLTITNLIMNLYLLKSLAVSIKLYIIFHEVYVHIL